MKLSDLKNEQALDTLADILEPVSEILADPEVKNKFRNEGKIKAVSYAIKAHKQPVIAVLALLDGKDPATYEFSFYELPKKLLEILSDPAFGDLFTSPEQKIE